MTKDDAILTLQQMRHNRITMWHRFAGRPMADIIDKEIKAIDVAIDSLKKENKNESYE